MKKFLTETIEVKNTNNIVVHSAPRAFMDDTGKLKEIDTTKTVDSVSLGNVPFWLKSDSNLTIGIRKNKDLKNKFIGFEKPSLGHATQLEVSFLGLTINGRKVNLNVTDPVNINGELLDMGDIRIICKSTVTKIYCRITSPIVIEEVSLRYRVHLKNLNLNTKDGIIKISNSNGFYAELGEPEASVAFPEEYSTKIQHIKRKPKIFAHRITSIKNNYFDYEKYSIGNLKYYGLTNFWLDLNVYGIANSWSFVDIGRSLSQTNYSAMGGWVPFATGDNTASYNNTDQTVFVTQAAAYGGGKEIAYEVRRATWISTIDDGLTSEYNYAKCVFYVSAYHFINSSIRLYVGAYNATMAPSNWLNFTPGDSSVSVTGTGWFEVPFSSASLTTMHGVSGSQKAFAFQTSNEKELIDPPYIDNGIGFIPNSVTITGGIEGSPNALYIEFYNPPTGGKKRQIFFFV